MKLSIKHMDLINRNELDALWAMESDPCVSLFMPTHRRGAETLQDPIRLKNLTKQAEKLLIERGLRSPEAQELTAPAHKLIDDNAFWERQCDGLALFASREGFRRYRLPMEFPELVVANKRFHLKPLIPVLSGEERFYVLALSQGGIRLFQGTRFTVGEIELKDVPTSLAEFMKFDDFEKSLQHHVGSSRGGGMPALFHGHGGGAGDETVKDRIVEFFRRLDRAVTDFLGSDHAPLVLAGLDFLRGLYKDVNHYPYLLDEGAEGNAEKYSAEELHRRAWEAVEPHFQKTRREALERYLSANGSNNGKAANALDSVVEAAFAHRVETLFVPLDRDCWGRFDAENMKIEAHDEREPADEDLLNLAAVHTLRNRGKVYTVASEEMPGKSLVAALYR